MHYLFTEYSLLFLSTALVSFFTAFLSWQRRSVNSANELTLVMIALGLWSFLLIFEAAAPTVEQKLIWSGFSGISAQTNLMEYDHGFFFWIGYFGYNNIILLIATILLFSFVIQYSRPFKAQGFTIIIAGLCPWSASVIYLAGANPVDGLDLVPVSIILSGVLLVFSILYRRFLDLAPIARKNLMETLQDGIIALDVQNRIQDINEAARTYLGFTDLHIIGMSVGNTTATVIPLGKPICSSLPGSGSNTRMILTGIPLGSNARIRTKWY